jgi:hypothetical protein
MKRVFFILIVSVLFISCKSREFKAAQHLQKARDLNPELFVQSITLDTLPGMSVTVNPGQMDVLKPLVVTNERGDVMRVTPDSSGNMSIDYTPAPVMVRRVQITDPDKAAIKANKSKNKYWTVKAFVIALFGFIGVYAFLITYRIWNG